MARHQLALRPPLIPIHATLSGSAAPPPSTPPPSTPPPSTPPPAPADPACALPCSCAHGIEFGENLCNYANMTMDAVDIQVGEDTRADKQTMHAWMVTAGRRAVQSPWQSSHAPGPTSKQNLLPGMHHLLVAHLHPNPITATSMKSEPAVPVPAFFCGRP